MGRKIALARFAFGATVIAPAAALAQDASPVAELPSARASDSVLGGEIVVTANRRSEPLQKVGIAVNAFSGAQLRALGVTNSQDITLFTPAVTSAGAQGGFLQTFSIRGVTQNEGNPHQEGPVAVYLDDVYISSLQEQSFATFDTERVEILKGPQGTLFGRNATGGLVHYISIKPSDQFSGYVDAKYGRFDLRQIQGAVGGPISGDKIMFRVAGIYSAHNPILLNPIGRNGWAEESYAARAHLLFRPSDRLELLLSGRYGRATISVSAAAQFPAEIAILDANGNQIDGRFLRPDETAQIITPSGPVGTRPVPGGDFFGYRDPDGRGRVSADPLVGRPTSYNANRDANQNYSDSYGGTARLTATLGGVTLVNILDYSHFRWRAATSLLGGGAVPFSFDTFARGIDQISNEFRASGDHGAFRWTAGVYYLNIDTDAGGVFGFLPGGLTGDGTVPGDQVIAFRQKTSSVSPFAQVEYDLSPTITLIAGGRYIHEEKSFRYRADLVTLVRAQFFNLFTFNQATTPLAGLNQDLYAIKAGVNFKPRKNLLLYATFNRGVKGGGFNAPPNPLALPLAGYVFRPEVLLAYEGGFKLSAPDRRITFNATGFYYDYGDYQGYRGIGTTNFVVNNRARIYGGELGLRANPAARLDLLLGGSYTDAVVEDVQLAPGFVANRRPAFSPRVQLNGVLRYEIPTSVGAMSFQTDASYRSSYYLQLVNYQDQRQSPFALVNARVGLARDAGWEIYAAARNLTDERYLTSSFDVSQTLGVGNVSWSMPRTWEFGLRYAFH